MKLLVFTQALDRDDPTLSVYHRWVAEIAEHFDSVIAICLKEGSHDLPKNVEVLSLGKERGRSRLKYVTNFFRYITSRRRDYDAVFVHMNQEYVLLGGLFWRLLGKPIYMWRNHHAGSFLTDIAAFFCRKVFCTSRYSYTAKYNKTILMPVGIDTSFFKRMAVTQKPRSILFLSRMAPVKKPHVLISALRKLKDRNIRYTASFYGDPLPKDKGYYDALVEASSDLYERIAFYPGVANDKTPEIYSSHEVFVNLSSSGMYDKTIFEAMACESLVLATNRNLEGLVDERFIAHEDDVGDIADKLEKLLASEGKSEAGSYLRAIADREHSLKRLAERLREEMCL